MLLLFVYKVILLGVMLTPVIAKIINKCFFVKHGLGYDFRRGCLLTIIAIAVLYVLQPLAIKHNNFYSNFWYGMVCVILVGAIAFFASEPITKEEE